MAPLKAERAVPGYQVSNCYPPGSSSFFIAWSTKKVGGFWRGVNSWNVRDELSDDRLCRDYDEDVFNEP